MIRAILICSALSGCLVHNSADGDVFGHTFAINVGHAEVADHEPDGTLWDSDTSAPDPYAILFVDGTQILRTVDISNSFTADWTDQVSRRIERGTKIELDVWDSDPIGMGDLIMRCGQNASV